MSNAAAFPVLLLLAAYCTGTAALLCIAWLTTQVARRSATTRHLIWLTAFGVVLLAPLWALVAPARFVLRASLAAPLPSLTKTAGRPSDAAATPSTKQENAAPPLLSVEAGKGRRPVLTLPPPEPPLNTRSAVSRMLAGVLGSRHYRAYLLQGALILWVGGVVYGLVQLLAGVRGVRNLRRRSSVVVGSNTQMDLDALSRRAQLKRKWELRISTCSGLPTAMTWGVLNPVVLLPLESASWSASQTEAILLHELAHVRRFDSLSQILIQWVCALNWFNPFVWWCAKNVRAEAEMAADDAVLRGGVKASTYAVDLLGVALAAQSSKQRQQQPPSAVAVPLLRHAGIEHRIRYIVSPAFCRRSATPLQRLAAVGASLVLLVFSCSLRPAVSVSFDNRAAATGLTLALARPRSQPAAPNLRARVKSILRHTEAARRRAESGAVRFKRLAQNRVSGLLRHTHHYP